MTKKHTHKGSVMEEVLFAFRRKLSDLLRKDADNFKCPISHIDAIMFIAEKSTPSMKEISTHLNITPPSTTAIIETLQQKNLISRVSNSEDRRTIRVELTPKAWKFLKSLHDKKISIFTDMLSKLSETDKKEFIRILTILIQD